VAPDPSKPSRLIELQEQRSKSIDEAGNALTSFSVNTNLVVFLVTAIVLFGFLWFTTRAMTQPISSMIEAVRHALDKNDFSRPSQPRR